MSISTFSDLVGAISRNLREPNLVANASDYVSMAEARIMRRLRVSAMETTATGTTSGAALSVPADYMEAIRLVVSNGSYDRELKYIGPDATARYSGVSSQPLGYTTLGNGLVLYPTPDADYAYTLWYYARVPALSAANASNWLLTAAPDLYLYGALLEAAGGLQNDPRVAFWQDRFQQAMDDMDYADDRQGFGGSILRVLPR